MCSALALNKNVSSFCRRGSHIYIYILLNITSKALALLSLSGFSSWLISLKMSYLIYCRLMDIWIFCIMNCEISLCLHVSNAKYVKYEGRINLFLFQNHSVMLLLRLISTANNIFIIKDRLYEEFHQNEF